MATAKDAPAPRAPKYVGRPGWPVGGHGFREVIPASVLDSIPAHKRRMLEREGYITDIQPAAPRPASENLTPVEPKEVAQRRLAREWLLARCQASGCAASDVWAALVRGDERIMPQGGSLAYSLPAEAGYLARLWETAQ